MKKKTKKREKGHSDHQKRKKGLDYPDDTDEFGSLIRADEHDETIKQN